MESRLPRAAAVEREKFLIEAAVGRHVTHVGFADTGMRANAQRDGRWIHSRLGAVASRLVGVDIDPDEVKWAQQQGYEVYLADCRDPDDIARQAIPLADVVIVGDVIEHIDNVGSFLDGLRALADPTGSMIITTPNAFRLTNFAAGLRGIEMVHPDHVAWYSWYTLQNVLERHGWQVQQFHTYLPPPRGLLAPIRGTARDWMTIGAGRLILKLERALANSIAPFLAEGLIAVCKPVRKPTPTPTD